ncbi:MAG: valine--tRNA ligase [Rickettsiales bacterium]|jgi:valyl-tRNA synthetase|nr:valine--tRNA ligase [Rickettsiales bacterium]
MKTLEKKYNFKEAEKKWQEYWQENKIYKFNWNDADRDNIYSIDAPPPTVSGTLHMGHILGYTQMDLFARYHRIMGKNVFFPFGIDDNGLPSERYVEKKIGKKGKSMNRQEFVEICDREIREVELQMKENVRSMEFSYDFNEEYRTISPTSRKISQMSFLDLFNKGVLERKKEPVIWDIVDQTALAQTEAEEKEIEGQMNYLKFELLDGTTKTPLEIMTTRPELLPACVAVFAHPDDRSKYKSKMALTPLGIEVPILFDESVEKDKGTGLMMCCTFGDGADVDKYKKYNLPLKIIINERGCLFFDNVPELDNRYKSELEGLFTTKAREKILEILEREGKITRTPMKILHNVKIGERSKSPLEIIVKEQWNIKVLDIKEELHRRASEVKWHPAWMEARIHSWIDGLNWNWCISRQRFFGVPIPCWYSKRRGEEGKAILPEIDQLPVDPTVDLPRGYNANEVTGEIDVFDTWATSAVSPQLSTWALNDEIYCDERRKKVLNLPFDLRPQGPEIIRTWAFCTLVKAHYHQNIKPWKNIFINGWCLASDGAKMSKSLGNGVEPAKIINEFGADAIRYWASNSQPGADTNYSVDMIKVGQKLVTKLFNGAKFAEIHFANLEGSVITAKNDVEDGKIFEIIDLWILSKIKSVIDNYNKYFQDYEHGRALDTIQNFFWDDFCDNYLEIVKVRCYGADGEKYRDKNLTDVEKTTITISQHSAIRTIYHVFKAILKLFAPFVPAICDEIYSCLYEDEFRAIKSISARGNCAKGEDFIENESAEKIGQAALQVIADVRKHKSEKNISIKEVVKDINVHTDVDLSSIMGDLKNVCNVNNFNFTT